ncbi:hypothetical protein DDR33_13585 [Pararcticibacter amylolyticus]|uniref:Uncharacterized protein n=1 Tax=Pararcticibacter amylolyticus TaxID=2173175 RepID=A0A2U2PFS8_9SPHI|nr:hypothetical protein DDR33_13585 [Pararcticibacter amylolyticus]
MSCKGTFPSGNEVGAPDSGAFFTYPYRVILKYHTSVQQCYLFSPYDVIFELIWSQTSTYEREDNVNFMLIC